MVSISLVVPVQRVKSVLVLCTCQPEGNGSPAQTLFWVPMASPFRFSHWVMSLVVPPQSEKLVETFS